MSGESDNIYVSDLPEDVSDAMVNEVFGAYGQVLSCKALPPKMPGMKGAALVRFANVEEAQWVVANLNGNIAQGLTDPIQVKFANSGRGYGKAGRDDSGYGYGGPYDGDGCGGTKGMPFSGGKGKGKKGRDSSSSCDIFTLLKGVSSAIPGAGKVPDENQIYIRGLPSDTSDLELYKMFSPFGAIQQRGVKAMLGQDGRCTGVGFVDFVDAAVAQSASATVNGTTMPDGGVLNVYIKNSTRKGGEKGGGKGYKGGW